MNEPTTEGLACRLERMERENRRLKRVGVAVLAALAAVVLMAQANPPKVAKVIEAERFVLQDAAGKVRGELSVLPGGQAGLGLYDQNANLRAMLSLWRDGRPSLELYDENGKLRAVIGHSTRKVIRMEKIEKWAESSLLLFDKAGQVIWKAPFPATRLIGQRQVIPSR